MEIPSPAGRLLPTALLAILGYEALAAGYFFFRHALSFFDPALFSDLLELYQATSKRSLFMTLAHAATKSFANFSPESEHA